MTKEEVGGKWKRTDFQALLSIVPGEMSEADPVATSQETALSTAHTGVISPPRRPLRQQ